MVFVYLLVALLGACAAVFALQNLDPVVVRFLTWRVDGAPLAIVIIVSLLAGVLVTSLVAGLQQIKLRLRVRQLERQLGHPPVHPVAPADPPNPDRRSLPGA